MGINGLHKALSFCTVKDNLRNYRNAIVAVDTSSWMHKSVYSISEKFVEATNSGRLDEGCVHVSARYIVTRCKELIEMFGMRAVYLVMDGKRIPLKAEESQDRDQKRLQNLREARRLKMEGQRWKAEDKYKSCIRIKDDFTRAVMKEVKGAFSEYRRVHFVNSPHEADSQLTRLVLDGVADAVITEDSDVLVYSAAAHVAFPIFFKLDRKTGNCDCIKMDWLLSQTSKEAEKPVTSNNTLEVIFRRLAFRQTKRRGFGVRLFVQGCILAGCDYTKNIEGIGTTNAFKLVRDNAFRNDSVRFRKMLESLPKKIKQKIDINEYEEILAKSEAIFFYHPVLHTDGNIKPLLKPRLSADECNDEHHFTDHFPFMSRFQGDWSFLGSMSSDSERNETQTHSESEGDTQLVPIEPSTLPKQSSSVTTNKRDNSELWLSSKPSKIVQNPYKKWKSCGSNGVTPLKERNVNAHINSGNTNLRKRQSNNVQNGAGDITKFLVKPDPRYARRSFPPTTKDTTKGSRQLSLSSAGSNFRILSSSFALKNSPGQSFFLPRSNKKQKFTASTKCSGDSELYATMNKTNFSYSPVNKSNTAEETIFRDDNGTENSSLDAKRDGLTNSDRFDFYDLTNSNSCDADELEDGAITGARETNEVARNDATIKSIPPQPSTTTTTTDCNDSCENLDTPFSAGKLPETKRKEITTSKYFPKRTSSRRVTLDSFMSPSFSGTSNDEGKKSAIPKSLGGDAITCSDTTGHKVQKNAIDIVEFTGDQEIESEPQSADSFPKKRPESLSKSILQKPPTKLNGSTGSWMEKYMYRNSASKARKLNSSVKNFFPPRRSSRDKN
jgi:exonuclease-1